MAASGTFGYGVEFAARLDISGVGGVVCKGLTIRPRPGHAPPRIIETAAGMLNSIGLANIGIDAAIAGMAPKWAGMPVPVIANISGETPHEYVEMAGRLDGVEGVAAIELNVSCPNVDRGGMLFGSKPEPAARLVSAVRPVTSLPLIVKLTPQAEDVPAVAGAVEREGADAVTVANTFQGLTIDIRRREPTLTNVTGGLSGPAIKPLTLRLVYLVAQVVGIPIIGCGGVLSGEDAIEYLMAGASAVQVGTATLVDPFAVCRIAAELNDRLARDGVLDPREVVGVANPRFAGKASASKKR